MVLFRRKHRKVKPIFTTLTQSYPVGYRVNSAKATKFRIWATGVLKEYMIKGFAMDDERLKQGKTAFGKDYFKDLLERVRSIRASERRIYQQITDIFAECSIDYDKNSPITRDFYAMVQNKFHYAITGQTAAEINIQPCRQQRRKHGIADMEELARWENIKVGHNRSQELFKPEGNQNSLNALCRDILIILRT